MQTTITNNISNLTIAIYDDKSSAAFIKNQKSRSRETQKKTYRKLKEAKRDQEVVYKRPKTRVRSVEMYDEDVYAEDYYADDGLERIDWDTLVYNTASFHRMFITPEQESVIELCENTHSCAYEEDEFDRNEMLRQYEIIVDEVCPEYAAHAPKDDDFDLITQELQQSARESPYHQEMLDLYAGIVADIVPQVVAPQVVAPAVVPRYTCCVGCRYSNGCRPFYNCERYDEVFSEDENDGEELLHLYNQMLDDMERGDA